MGERGATIKPFVLQTFGGLVLKTLNAGDFVIKYIKLGWASRFWFEECERVLVDLFPDPTFAANLLAATSPRNTLRSNVKLFRRALFEWERGELDLTGYFPSVAGNVSRVLNGEPIQGRKVRAFAAAMTGDVNAVVVDMWLMRAFGYRGDRPTPSQFASITRDVRELAPYYGLQPRQLSAVLWAGCRRYYTGQTENHYTAILRQEFQTLFSS